MFKTPHLEYKAQYSCPEGTETKQEVKREPVMPPGVETEQIVKKIQVIPPIIITRTVSIFNSSECTTMLNTHLYKNSWITP
jgi:hypothetical protein